VLLFYSVSWYICQPIISLIGAQPGLSLPEWGHLCEYILCKLLALVTKISLEWKWLSMTNMLPYITAVLLTTVKRFIVQAH